MITPEKNVRHALHNVPPGEETQLERVPRRRRTLNTQGVWNVEAVACL